jgi:hypothetical protein
MNRHANPRVGREFDCSPIRVDTCFTIGREVSVASARMRRTTIRAECRAGRFTKPSQKSHSRPSPSARITFQRFLTHTAGLLKKSQRIKRLCITRPAALPLPETNQTHAIQTQHARSEQRRTCRCRNASPLFHLSPGRTVGRSRYRRWRLFCLSGLRRHCRCVVLLIHSGLRLQRR